MVGNEIYSAKLAKGNRTYFFDIKESEPGDLYLIVSESKKTECGFERHRLMIFEENMKDFVDVFRSILIKLKELKEGKAKESKTYSVEKIRQSHKQAYMPWTTDNDTKLELLFCEGKNVKELTQIFECNEGAISSRILSENILKYFNNVYNDFEQGS